MKFLNAGHPGCSGHHTIFPPEKQRIISLLLVCLERYSEVKNAHYLILMNVKKTIINPKLKGVSLHKS